MPLSVADVSFTVGGVLVVALGAVGLTVDDSAAYFTDSDYGRPGLIRRVLLDGSSDPVTLAMQDPGAPTDIVVLGGQVYWTDASDPGGSLSAVSGEGGFTQLLL